MRDPDNGWSIEVIDKQEADGCSLGGGLWNYISQGRWVDSVFSLSKILSLIHVVTKLWLQLSISPQKNATFSFLSTFFVGLKLKVQYILFERVCFIITRNLSVVPWKMLSCISVSLSVLLWMYFKLYIPALCCIILSECMNKYCIQRYLSALRLGFISLC